ncbi:MAG: hypothetical protein HZA54_02175 [Planctomycetes bacterium]|nr:hypothetical protein [Planctomycetota bacterium]
MPRPPAKRAAIALIRDLPETSTWEEVLDQIYVRKKIEAGLKAADEGRVLTHDEVKRRFGRGK